MLDLHAHAEYLRKKSARFRYLASGFDSATSRELLTLAGDMEASAAEFDRRAASGVAARPASSPAPTSSVREALEERRLTFRVLRHWTEMAIAQRYPRKDNIDPWLLGEGVPRSGRRDAHLDSWPPRGGLIELSDFRPFSCRSQSQFLSTIHFDPKSAAGTTAT